MERERRERIGQAIADRQVRVRVKQAVGVRRPWSCGFCSDRPSGRCGDTHSRCRGTWNRAVPRTETNPEGSITCACHAAAHHHKELAVIYVMPWEEVNINGRNGPWRVLAADKDRAA